MPRALILSLVISFLTGCATGYQAQGFTGGFSESQLTPNVWQVRFAGNAYTSSERASDFVLLRTAEIMLEHGYEYFVVVDSVSEARAYTYTTPQTSTTTYSGTVNAGTQTFGNTSTTTGTVYGSARTNTYGGQTRTVYKPRTNLIAVGVAEPVDDGSLVFDARFLGASLRQKYGIEQQDE